MLKEPRLAVFYSPPKHDLKLNYDEEMRLEQMSEETIRPWPDTGEMVIHIIGIVTFTSNSMRQ